LPDRQRLLQAVEGLFQAPLGSIGHSQVVEGSGLAVPISCRTADCQGLELTLDALVELFEREIGASEIAQGTKFPLRVLYLPKNPRRSLAMVQGSQPVAPL